MFSGEGSSSHPSQQNSLFSLLTHPSNNQDGQQQPFRPILPPPPTLGPRLSALPIQNQPQQHQQHPPPRRQGEVDLTGEGDDEEDRPMAQREGKRQRQGGGGGGGGIEGHLHSSSSSSSPRGVPAAALTGPPTGWAPALPLPLWSQDVHQHPHQQHQRPFQPSPTSTSSFPSNFIAQPPPSSSGSPARHFPPYDPTRQSSTSSFPPPPAPHHQQQQQQQYNHRPNPSSSSSSSSSRLGPNATKRQPSPIDVDDYPSPPPRLPSPPPPPPPPPPSNNPQPTLIGYLDTTALILYPCPYLDNTVEPGQALTRNYSKGESLIVGEHEWARVKLKHKPLPAGSPVGTGETINIIPFGVPSNQAEPFGVVSNTTADVLGVFLSKGLIRLEGWIRRGGAKNKFCQVLHLFLLTIPPNIGYVSNTLAEKTLFLGHPRLPWRAEWFQNCIYANPHLDAGVANLNNRRNPNFRVAGTSVSASKVVEQQRSQVDEVFKSLKGGDDFDETHPGPMIGAELYPHQKKALTFLRERENEKLPPMGVRRKDFKPATPGSLWEPMMEQTGRKGKSSSKPSSWEHLVTKEIVRNKPRECRGAILADDMGLGKSLSIVSLVASTIGTARKFDVKPLKDLRAPPSASTSVSDNEDFDEPSSSSVDASHFAGAVFGMPSVLASSASSSASKTARQQQSEAKKKEERAREGHARKSRIKVRSRATLIVCPLTTVSNWEDQFMEHWSGPVTVYSGGQGKDVVQMKKNGRTRLSIPKLEPDSSDSDFSSSSSDDDDDHKHVLRIYVYHGNNRQLDPDYISDFDVVITTFSTLATEFSKQTRTAEGAPSSGTSTPVGGRSVNKDEDDDSDGVMEVDANGVEVPSVVDEEAKELEKATTKKRKRGKGAISNLGPANEAEVTSPLQQIEWFRVVLDEAHFIKDANTVAARAACYLEAQRRICLTGTPIQNKLDDLWALIKFIRLEPFDDKSVWAEYVSSPAKYGDSIGVARLQVIMRHITLRRTKETKLASGKTLLDLPPRKDKIVYLTFSEKEKAIYDTHLIQSKADFNNMLEEGDGGKISNSNYVNILQSILRLRQICDHYLLINDKSAPEDDVDSGEPLDYEDAVAAINVHGINQRRAAAVMSFFKEEEMCVCSECDLDLSCLAAGPAAEVEEGASGSNGKPVVKRKGKKKIPQAILTKCQHLYCLACFKSSIYSAWPKSIGGVGRSCSKCASGLRLATDCIEIVPPGSSEAASSSEFAARSKSSKKSAPRKRRREPGSELVYSTKIRMLMDDLKAYSALNPYSANFAGNPHAQEKVFTGGVGDGASIAELEGEGQPSGPSSPNGDQQDFKPSLQDLGIRSSNSSPYPSHPNDLLVPSSNENKHANGNGDVPMFDQKPDVPGPSSSFQHNALTPPRPPPTASYQNDPVFTLANELSQPDHEANLYDLEPEPTDIFADLEEPYASDVKSGKPIKTIVFSQWTSMLDRIEDALSETGIKYDRLDGTMKRDDRTKAMERLRQDPSCEVLLVSLRAGGVGLNLTTANRVYLIDPFWNPAVENQAVDRIHRLGQTRPVISTKYIMSNSMEERMLEIQKKKEALANMSLSQTMTKKELHEKRMEDLKTLFS